MRILCLSLLVAVSILPLTARAQRLGGERFSPSGSEDGILGTEGADSRMPFRPYVSLWAHYAHDPVVIRRADGERLSEPVAHAVGANLVASLALWRGLEFGVGAPMTIWSDGDDTRNGGINAPGFAVGDLTVRVGYRLRLAEHSAIALHVPMLIPISGDDNVMSLGLGVRPTLAFMQRFGMIELLVNGSYFIRERQQRLDFDGGDEIGLRAAARFAVDPAWQSAVLVDLGLSTTPRSFLDAASTPAEGRVGFEHWIAEHVRLTAYVGTGLTTGVGAPDFRGGIGISYGDNPPFRPRPEPAPGDADGDGVLDAADECVYEPEDPDGFQDEDGCPEQDNDQDGILDMSDGCPSQPETMNGISDEDGCPDRVRLEDTLITTFENVHFRTGSDEILPRSFPMLNEVVGILGVNPGLRIRVEGHTDNVGDDAANMDLSQRRAESVRRYLIENGVPDTQLTAQGFGETRPVDTNDTPEGRAKNRRVEFHIVSGNQGDIEVREPQ